MAIVVNCWTLESPKKSLCSILAMLVETSFPLSSRTVLLFASTDGLASIKARPEDTGTVPSALSSLKYSAPFLPGTVGSRSIPLPWVSGGAG